jgi:ParB family transcriptional regulator, chromosome partitioning protein
MTRAALGKGLSALIREPISEPTHLTEAPPVSRARTEATLQVDIDLIDPNPYQPRTRFTEETLDELARSIQSAGIIQPLILRPNGTRYQLVAGERRWRAAQRAGLHQVPAIVRELSEEMALEITLVENLQREDLSPIEQAKAFESLMTHFHLTQEEVAERTGKDRATVANVLRLLKLEEPIQELLDSGRLSAGHGRALLAIQDSAFRLRLAQRAARESMNVRQIERLATRSRKQSAPTEDIVMDPNVKAALEELQQFLGTKVVLKPCGSKRPGELIIEYYDDRQLIGLYERIIG